MVSEKITEMELFSIRSVLDEYGGRGSASIYNASRVYIIQMISGYFVQLDSVKEWIRWIQE